MEDADIPERELSDWIPITDKYTLAVLGKAGEEICEGGSAIFRCIIQGINEKEPVTGKVNRHWLEDEIADIRAMLNHVEIRLGLDMERIGQRQKAKFRYKARWFDRLLKGLC